MVSVSVTLGIFKNPKSKIISFYPLKSTYYIISENSDKIKYFFIFFQKNVFYAKSFDISEKVITSIKPISKAKPIA